MYLLYQNGSLLTKTLRFVIMIVHDGFLRVIVCAALLLFLGVFSAATAAAQDASAIPPYQVVFDDFDYDATGYPDTLGIGISKLFGKNGWLDRNGEAAYTGHAWYYFNWRWQNEGKTIHPSARFEINTHAPYSIRLTASEGYTRVFFPRDRVPIQIQSGFAHEHGTWMLSTRFDDLEAIPYFTQAFWLISPMATSPERSGVETWGEFNFEWQNWFAVLAQPGTNAWNTDLSDDAWAPSNKWVERQGYTGTVFPDGRIPSPQRRTYMANGMRMYDTVRGVLDTGETAGGIPLRNTRLSDAEPFSCYTSVQGVVVDIDDPVACMGFVLRDLEGKANPWVHLMIQYDGRVARYALLALTGSEDHVYRESRVILNRRSLPLTANLGMHTPNDLIVLGEGEGATFEMDWFYYSPVTDLDPWDVLADVKAFRERDWSRVNLDGDSLEAPHPFPWKIRAVRPPTAYDPGWIVDTTIRGTNGIEVQWNYRTRNGPDELFSNWSGWRKGGFRFELDVRAKDHNATDIGGLRFFADARCTRYNYVTGATSLCEGGLIEASPRSNEQIPRAVVLDGNYPNPFPATTTIRFGLVTKVDVTLIVYDALGRPVARLVDRELGGGFYSITWDASNLPSGTYFYRLIAGRFSTTKTLTVVR